MSFEGCRCVIPVCDACDTDCWDGDESPPHFATFNERVARELLATQYGWRITQQDDGTHLMLCPHCARNADCAASGHQWYEPPLDYRRPGEAPIEMCSHCGCVRRDHPEASGIALTAAEAAVLDAYETEFSEEAI